MADTEKVVILYHGIRTRAAWQETIKPLLEKEGFVVHTPGYGFFDIFRFLLPLRLLKNKPLEKIRKEYRQARALHKNASISVIAHSFGTYLVGRLLTEEPDVKIDKLILCGAVVSDEYPWFLVNSVNVNSALNESSYKDVWPLLAKVATWGYGATGTFGIKRTGINDRRHGALTHSEYLTEHFATKFWLPFLKSGSVTPGDQVKGPPYWMNVLTLIQPKYIILVLLLYLLVIVGKWVHENYYLRSVAEAHGREFIEESVASRISGVGGRAYGAELLYSMIDDQDARWKLRIKKAEGYRYRGDYDRAIEILEDVEMSASQMSLLTQEMVYSELGLNYSLIGNNKKAENYHKEATRVAGHEETTIEAIRLGIKLKLNEEGNRYKERLQNVVDGTDLPSEGWPKAAMLEARTLLALIHYANDELDLAMREVNRVIRATSDSYHPALYARAYGLRGDILLYEGEHERALQSYKQAERVYSNTGSIAGKAGVLSAIARVKVEQKEYKAAQAFIEQAEVLYSLIPSPYHDLKISDRKARLHHSSHSLYEAYRQYHVSRKLAERMEVPELVGYAHLNLGSVALSRGNWSQAKRHAEQALTNYGIAEVRYGQVGALWLTARVAIAEGNYSDAEEVLHERIDESTIGQQGGMNKALLRLAAGDLALLRGKLEAAMTNYKRVADMDVGQEIKVRVDARRWLLSVQSDLQNAADQFEHVMEQHESVGSEMKRVLLGLAGSCVYHELNLRRQRDKHYKEAIAELSQLGEYKWVKDYLDIKEASVEEEVTFKHCGSIGKIVALH